MSGKGYNNHKLSFKHSFYKTKTCTCKTLGGDVSFACKKNLRYEV